MPERPPWPTDVQGLQGEGDFDISWRGRSYSGSASVVMQYPRLLLLEVYGPFGQTLLYLKKQDDQFLLVSSEGKITDAAEFKEKYGFSVEEFMDDLAGRGEMGEAPGMMMLQRADYRVAYSWDRKARRKVCWEGKDGTICLTFKELTFS